MSAARILKPTRYVSTENLYEIAAIPHDMYADIDIHEGFNVIKALGKLEVEKIYYIQLRYQLRQNVLT